MTANDNLTLKPSDEDLLPIVEAPKVQVTEADLLASTPDKRMPTEEELANLTALGGAKRGTDIGPNIELRKRRDQLLDQIGPKTNRRIEGLDLEVALDRTLADAEKQTQADLKQKIKETDEPQKRKELIKQLKESIANEKAINKQRKQTEKELKRSKKLFDKQNKEYHALNASIAKGSKTMQLRFIDLKKKLAKGGTNVATAIGTLVNKIKRGADQHYCQTEIGR